MELLDFGARRYDPRLGRFLSPDTIIPDPANPQSFNRYSYVRNNPLRYIDPTGHQECGTEDDTCEWYRARGYEKKDGEDWSYTGNFEIKKDNPEFYNQDGTLNYENAMTELYGVAENVWSDLGSVEAAARVAELAAHLSNGDAQVFMDLTNPVLSGEVGTGLIWNEGDWLPSGQSGRDPSSKVYAEFLESNGFAAIFRDPLADNNQVHHFWHAMQVSYYHGPIIANGANIQHEFREGGWTVRGIETGKSIQDFNTSVVANYLGTALNLGVNPEFVAPMVRVLGGF